jgi:hypothetical protein
MAFIIHIEELKNFKNNAISVDAHELIGKKLKVFQALVYLSDGGRKKSDKLGYIPYDGQIELRFKDENLDLFTDHKVASMLSAVSLLLEKVKEYGDFQTKGLTEDASIINDINDGAPRKAWEVLGKLDKPLLLEFSGESTEIEPKPKIRHLNIDGKEEIFWERCNIETLNFYTKSNASFVKYFDKKRSHADLQVTEQQISDIRQLTFEDSMVDITFSCISASGKKYKGVLQSFEVSPEIEVFEELSLFSDLGVDNSSQI